MTEDALDAFRGSFPRTTLNARRIAAALEAPGCQRRTILDASSVSLDKLGPFVSQMPRDRQSPFAITRGNQFEERVTDNGMAAVVALVREHLELEIPEVRQVDLSARAVKALFPKLRGIELNERRARLTSQRIEEMLTQPDTAPNLIRHAMTRLAFGGETAFLEQDVLAFAIEGRIHVVEIKSFPRIDGRADPEKASAAVRQSAVYVLSLKETIERIGASPDLVDTRVLVILPENLSFRPVAVVVDTDFQLRRLHRQLETVPAAADILHGLPDGAALPALPADTADEDEIQSARRDAQEVLSRIPPRFADGCTSCALFHFCRDEAERQRSVSRLGGNVAGMCGSITDISEALALANGQRKAANASEAAVATLLARSAAAVQIATERGAM